MLRSAGERMARNTPIQGTAADLLKLAMIEVQRVIDTEARDVKMLLDGARRARARGAGGRRPTPSASGSSTRWKACAKLDVPLKVDLGIGRTWADAK